MRTFSSVAFVLLASTAACSSPAASSDEGGGAAAFSNGSSALVGTWDVALVANGDQSSSVLKISANSLSFAVGGSTITGNIGGNVVAVNSDGDRSTVATTHTAQKLDTGIFPYAIGGNWTFKADTSASSTGCAADVRDGSMKLTCTDLGEGLRDVFASSDSGAGTTTVTRSSTLTSRFGSLGGTWRVVAPSGTCDVKFEGSIFDASCSPGEGATPTTISITFGDGIASGKIDGGELSAKKR